MLGIDRVGAWLRECEGWRRLPDTVFAVAEALDRFRLVEADGDAARLGALAALREALPAAATAGSAEGTGLLGTVTIIEADALSLDTMGDGDRLQVIPVLHRAGDFAGPFLPVDRQATFGREQFLKFPGARGVYSLPGGVYIVIAPPLRQALEVVRRLATESPAARRAFFREPQAAIGDEVDAALLDSLVVETKAWSERVLGLGLFEKRVLPWVQVAGSDWFGNAPGGEAAAREPKGLLIGDVRLPLTPGQAGTLQGDVRAAMAANQPTVLIQTPAGSVSVPATVATLDALSALLSSKPAPASPAEVLLIKPNEEARDIEALVQARPTPPSGLPRCLSTLLKKHQREGLEWLQRNWRFGSPGVLLADDMGLGKTLQGLSFLAWLQEGMASGIVPTGPVLIVAPTGLLENWRAEHDRHLKEPGLGRALLAYGKGLAELRRSAGSGNGLNATVLRQADWVLTTYETLRDYDRDFGAVRFVAMLLDEAQKVKTPGIRLTDAAKAMNADFRIAMTGTPVENRLSDLWCIVDGVAPGHLGELRRFSAQYEASDDPDRMEGLKTSLDTPLGGRPPLMLRRMKEDKLPDLPPRTEVIRRAEMSGVQLAAYDDAVALARAGQGPGHVLEALQRLRAVSLHPGADEVADDDMIVAGSARLRLTLETLDGIARSGERALVFVDDLDLMARLAGLLQRRYRLQAPPMTISGKVSGAARQARVDRFQGGPDGFDVMLLSPRAGGVGLTLTRANHVIHLARWWNPAVEDQCTGRVLRIGQVKPVSVTIPLATLPDGRRSFDENLHALLKRKRALMHRALMPPEARPDELSALLEASLS